MDSESTYKCINMQTDIYCVFMKYFEWVHDDYDYDNDDDDDDDDGCRITYQSAAGFISLYLNRT